MVRVHSFDVFDTSLIRKVAAPTDVFRLLGMNIARQAGLTSQSDFTEDFLSARIRAEQQAKLHCEETTIDEIWVNLRKMMPELSSVGPQDELDVERKLLLPNAIVAQKIVRLRSEGARIIFISDTYLPEEFVREQLLRHGLAQSGDGIYVSSASAVTKRGGELFNVVLSREGVTAGDLHHYGDNPHSDLAMPRRFGIGATLLTSSYLNIWERAVLSKDVQFRMTTSLLTGSMRAFRLSTFVQSKSGADELVATLLGPALMVWAAWVLRAAQRDGVHRLYFVSRQGHLLCRAARVLAPYFGSIDCRDLKISRQSILLPSTDEISPSTMAWLRRPRPMSLAELVAQLGLNWLDVGPHFLPLAKGQGESGLLITDREWDAFWDVVQNTAVSALLRDQIQDTRGKALAYLRAEGLCDEVPAGIVDIGWYMAVQTCLQRLLGSVKSTSTLRGYFLGLCRGRMPPADAGKVSALFYEQAFDHQGISPEYEIFSRIDILDHIFGLAPHGSVRGFKLNGSSVEAVCPPEPDLHIEFVDKLGDAVEAFCKSNSEDAVLYSDNATAREIIDALFSAWCNHPNKVALKALDNIIVTDGTDGNRVATPFAIRTAFRRGEDLDTETMA